MFREYDLKGITTKDSIQEITPKIESKKMNKYNQLGIPKVLLVANVAKEHVLKFHVPTIKHLSEEGWQVDVACGGKDIIPYCHHQYELPIDRSPFKTNFLKAIRELRTIISKEQYDIVYCHTEVGGIVGRLAAKPFRKNGLRVVKLDHGLYFYKGASWITWFIHYPIDKLLSEITDTFITINKEDYDFVNNHFKKCKSYIIHGIGVDPNRFVITDRGKEREQYRAEMNIPRDAIVLIYLAELIENKNQTFLMDAFQQVLKDNKNVYLVLAGFDHTNGEVEQYAHRLGVHENIRFLGWRNDVNNLYAMSDICTASSIREGFGLNLVEAMYCGVPVVATNNRGHSTIIRDGENGFLVNLGDVNSFAKRILQLCDDEKLRQRFIEVSHNEEQKYASDNILKKISKILNSEL